MDVSNKIYISIMCGRLFKIISKHVVKCQFGSTPRVGSQDGTFTIKTLLHLRQNHNLPTWVAFGDLALHDGAVVIGKNWLVEWKGENIEWRKRELWQWLSQWF